MLFDSADSEIEYPHNQEYLSKHFKIDKNHFFEVFGKIFEAEYKLGLKRQIRVEIFINIVITLQTTSIIWYPDLGISDWRSYMEFWKMIGIINYDKAGALFGLLDFCYYGIVSINGVFCVLLSIFLILYYLEKKPPNVVVLFLRKIAKIISTVSFIPIVLIFLTVLKYSIFSFSLVEELDNTDASQIDFGIIGVIFSVFFLLLTILIAFLYEIFSCDICHMNFNKNIKAKSSTSLDLQRQSFFIFMCASYVCFDSKYAIYHQLICFLLSFLLEIKTIWSLQYFNCIENTIQACKMGSISLTLLIFIFGELLDNSLLILVFTLIFQPILLFYLIFYTLKSYKNTKDYDNSSRNQFDFERKYRLLLINPNPDNKYQILKLFDKQWKMIHFKKNKLFVIWEFNFCIYILNDERLARVKLTKLALCENSFEGNFQEWKVLNWLKNSEGREFPEIKYLEFLQKFGKLKERDEELCYLIIKLQTEFASRAPRIRWLEKLSTKTAKIMQKVNEGYKIDTEKYKNTETVSLYASFLKNILKNYNDSILLEKKRSQIDYTLRKDYYLEKYGSQIGILLISCEQNSFGNIIYLNDMASEILKLSMNEICGNSIFSFIPSSYRISHEKLMKKFVNDSKSVQIPCHNYLFFESQYGFLIECDALIKLTAFYNNCFYLISFNQKQAPRQFALISEEGIIIGHSELFSNCLGCNFQCIKNKNISEIFPFIGMNKLTENLPWVETIKGKDIGLIYIKKIIREEILNVLYVIDNESEIKKIENFNDSCNVKISFTFEQNEDCPQINEIPHENKSEAKKLQILFENVEETSHIECDTDFTQQNQIFSDNKICNPSSLTRSSIYLEQLKNLIFKSKQKIATLKCVLFIVTLAAIITMFSIMGYIINDVYLTSSMIIFRNLGNLLYNIGLSADIARTIVKSIGYQIDYSSQNAPFLNAMYELQTIQNNILSDFKKWEFCAASNIVTDSLIPLWTFDENLPKIINKNMYNAIESFVFHIKSMIYALENNQTYINHAKFLIINGIGQTYDYFNHTILDLENCAVNRIETIGDIIYTLIFWGFAALGILLLIVFIFIYLTAKKIDEFWNFFIKSTQIQLMRLKTEAIERLGYAHNTEVNIEESINSSLNKKKHRVRTLIEINFTWRILVFFIISASYYFVIYFYLYPDCQSYMKNRPRLLNNFNIRRSLVSRVCMLSRDVYTPWFNKNFLLSYGFANSNFLVDLNAKILREKNKELREEKLMKMMSKELKQRIFESTNTTTPILKFGTDTAVEISIYDSTNIAYTSYIPAELILKYVAYLQIVQNNIGIEFELADNDSYNAINYQLNIIIATTAVYSIIFCALFFIYYLPFLHYQIKLLNLLSYLIEVLAID